MARISRDYLADFSRRTPGVIILTRLGFAAHEIAEVLECSCGTISSDRERLRADGRSLDSVLLGSGQLFSERLVEYAKRLTSDIAGRSEIDQKILSALHKKLDISSIEAYLKGAAQVVKQQKMLRAERPEHTGYVYLLQTLFGHLEIDSSVSWYELEYSQSNYLRAIAGGAIKAPANREMFLAELRNLLIQVLGGEQVILPLSPRDIEQIDTAIQACLATFSLEQTRARMQMIMDQRILAPNGSRSTLAGLSEQFGITRERIRQLEARLLRELRQSRYGLSVYTLSAGERFASRIEATNPLKEATLSELLDSDRAHFDKRKLNKLQQAFGDDYLLRELIKRPVQEVLDVLGGKTALTHFVACLKQYGIDYPAARAEFKRRREEALKNRPEGLASMINLQKLRELDLDTLLSFNFVSNYGQYALVRAIDGQRCFSAMLSNISHKFFNNENLPSALGELLWADSACLKRLADVETRTGQVFYEFIVTVRDIVSERIGQFD